MRPRVLGERGRAAGGTGEGEGEFIDYYIIYFRANHLHTIRSRLRKKWPCEYPSRLVLT